jgi:hypothetical protein
VSGSGFFGDLAGVVAQVAASLGGAAAAVSARASTSDFAPALEQFLGSGQGLSASVITRLTEQWRADARAFGERSLAEADYVYLWVDGIHPKGSTRGPQGVSARDDRGACQRP